MHMIEFLTFFNWTLELHHRFIFSFCATLCLFTAWNVLYSFRKYNFAIRLVELLHKRMGFFLFTLIRITVAIKNLLIQFPQTNFFVVCCYEARIFCLNSIQPFDTGDVCRNHIRFDVISFLLESIKLVEKVQVGILDVVLSKLVFLVCA